jgi:hypothetical protein
LLTREEEAPVAKREARSNFFIQKTRVNVIDIIIGLQIQSSSSQRAFFEHIKKPTTTTTKKSTTICVSVL